MATNLSFQRIATVTDTGLTVGRINFETSTGLIKVATSTSAYDAFGAASTAETNAKEYADSLLAWSEFE